MTAVETSSAPADVDELLRTAAHGPGRVKRERALAALGRVGAPAIEPLREALAASPNENVRLAAAAALGAIGGAEAVRCLAAAGGDERRAVRAAAVTALGHTGDSAALDAVAEVLLGDPEHQVRLAGCAALAELGGGTGFALRALETETEDFVRSRLAHVLGELGDDAAGGALAAALGGDPAPATRRAAAGALARLGGPGAVAALRTAARADEDPKVRARCLRELARAAPEAAVPALVEALVVDPEPSARGAAAEGLAPIADLAAKLDALARVVDERRIERSHVDLDRLAAGLGADRDGDRVTAALVRRSLGATRRLTGVLAGLLVAACGGDPGRAGSRVAAVQAEDGVSDDQVEALRIEIGGERALDPVLRELRRDLGTYFQEPIDRLNTATHANWQATIDSARFGFRARNAMSIAVFVIGMGLVLAASVRLLSGQLTATELLGPGVSLAGGLSAVLTAVYAGPHRDVRSAVADLGAASAAFIGYVHVVLQTSHVFAAKYLRESATLDDVEHASRLIRGAMDATVDALQGDERG